LQKQFAHILHPDDLSRGLELFQRVLRGEKTATFQLRVLSKSGDYLVGEFMVTPQTQSGSVIGIVGIARDITERKRAEESLKQSEENARKLAQENAAMAEIGRIISSTLNIDEIYESFSKEAKKLVAFDRIVINIIDTEKSTVKNAYIAGERVRDRNVEEIYPLKGSGNEEMVRTKSTLLIQAEDFNEYKDRFPMLLSTFQAGFRSAMNVPLFSKGKIIGALLLRSRNPYAYTDKDVKLAERIGSQIAGAIANAQLFTERLRAEEEKAALLEQLRQSQKMEAIGRLAGGVAHDFNNLLTIIKGNSELSLMDLGKDDPLRGNLEGVLRASGRASDLIRQLLAFSRRQILEMKVLDLNSLLVDLDKMLHRLIGEDIELVIFPSKDLGRVKADAGQIEQVILNLAVNSRDAMPSGGRLTIETANVELDDEYARRHVAVIPGRYVMLSVSDTGAGMTPEVRDRVFEPFFTTKESSKGTGLGLSTVYGIVKQSGGNIWVYSEPGKGTTFKIYLPRVDEPLGEVVREKAAEGGLPRGSETILIVEDDEDVRDLTVRALKMQGYRVLETSNGSNALHVSEHEAGPIHLMVTDVVMPGMNGPELAKRLNPLRPKMKVLYISGYTDNAIVHHGVLEKGVNYIQKPFTVEGLARKVKEVLDQ
jgi:signal transduction histidine kinase